MLPKGLYNHTKFATYFLNMGLTPPPLLNNVQKKCGSGGGWLPLVPITHRIRVCFKDLTTKSKISVQGGLSNIEQDNGMMLMAMMMKTSKRADQSLCPP